MKIALTLFLAAIFIAQFPDEIERLINRSEQKIVCERNKPRRIGTVFYLGNGTKRLIRIFSKNGEDLEIWLNYDTSRPFYYIFPDKIFYHAKESGWVSRESLKDEASDALDQRIKFTRSETQFFITCLEKQLKSP